jgi:hypothetical protein
MKGIVIMMRFVVCLLLSILLAAPVLAQETPSTRRDPLSLAADYLGYDGAPVIVDLPQVYEPGDMAQFWVAKHDADQPVAIMAELAAASPNVSIWVEPGVEIGQAQLGALAQQIGGLWNTLRLRANFVEPPPLPIPADTSDFVDRGDLLAFPDSDGDERLHVVYARDLREEAYFNPADTLPAPLAPGFGSAREVIYLNTTPFGGIPLDDGLYIINLLRVLYGWTMTYNIEGQAGWLTEALGSNILLQFQQTSVAPGDIDAYFAAPESVPMLRPSTFTNRAAVNGVQQIYLGYLAQRLGTEVFRDLYLTSGEGFAPAEGQAAARSFIDPSTGAPITAVDVFADMLVANLLNAPVGDGRFQHRAIDIAEGRFPRLTRAEQLPASYADAAAAQFGAAYTIYVARELETVALAFAGASKTARLPMPDREPNDLYYWTGRGGDRRLTLTRTFDLLGSRTPALTFDAWYELADGWNYLYVSVSNDGGATWDILTPEYAGDAPDFSALAPRNGFGVAYGDGLTGISSPVGAQPFPIIGVVVQSDGVTLGEVTPGGPAQVAGIQPGDVMIGVDGARWATPPNIFDLLARYNPGETLNLLVLRSGAELEVPIVLGAHPTRIKTPRPLWLPYRVDLSAYAGEVVALRFDYVSQPGREDNGVALDNISLESGSRSLFDDASADGVWDSVGWQRVDNAVTQPWLVQAVTSGTQTSPARIRRLIAPGDRLTAGEWRFVLSPNEALVMIASPLSDATWEPAAYSLEISRQPAADGG